MLMCLCFTMMMMMVVVVGQSILQTPTLLSQKKSDLGSEFGVN